MTLAECCFGTGGVGGEASIADVRVVQHPGLNEAAALFGESASRVVVSVNPDNLTEVLQKASAADVPAAAIGETGGNRLRIAVAGRSALDLAIDDLERVWLTAIERVFTRKVA